VKSISISITTKSPLLLSQGPPAHNLIKTLDFIPGNTIRGLLAQQYLSKGGQAGDSDFVRLFLSGETRFGFARIEGCQTIPLSARSCKYNYGFKNDRGGHGVIDVLLSDKEKRCEKQGCNLPVDYFEGFWNPATCRKQRISKRLITRTAIDPVLGSASTGQLYTQQVIEEGQTFCAIIEVLEDLAGALGKLFNKNFTARIGTGRSRGQGWVEVRQEAFSLPSWGKARERFKRFKHGVLVVTLLSDAIFHDKYLRDCTTPDISHLKSMDIEPDDWESKPSKAFASSRMVFGFDGIPLQLPRVPRLAVTAGSVFLFKKKNGREPAIPDSDGIGWIGDNNREGFGQAILWHPFHLDPEEEVVSCLVD
jgi:CRISPR-associated Csx10 family RAMP protein